MINYNYDHNSSDMWYVKCEMWKCLECSKYNVTMEKTAVFASNLTTNVCLMLSI